MKRASRIEITELFLVKTDNDKTFIGEITKETTDNGITIVRGSVIIHEGKAWSVGESQNELARNLDCICTMKLNKDLHDYVGRFDVIANTEFFLN